MSDKALTAKEAQSEWDTLATAREAGDPSPSNNEAVATPATENEDDDAPAKDAADDEGDDAPAGDAPAEDADPYEGLSPALKAKFLAMEAEAAKVKELDQKVKTAEGRVAAMQREADVARNAAKAVVDAPSAAAIAAAKLSTDKWDALKADFPEWADATDQFVKAQLAGLKPSETKGMTPAEVAVAVEKAVEESKVEDKHEGFKDLIATPEFATWYEAQDDKTKKLGASRKAKDAISLLDSYKASTSTSVEDVQKGRKDRLAAAVNQKPSGAAAGASKTTDQMTPQELWAYEAKRAAKKGKDRGLVY